MIPVVLVIVYVLSLGPVNWLYENGHISGPALAFVQTLYLPLIWILLNTETLAELLNWYIELWWP